MPSKRSFIGGSCDFQSGSVQTSATAGKDIVTFEALGAEGGTLPETVADVPYLLRRSGNTTQLANGSTAAIPFTLDITDNIQGKISYSGGVFTVNETGFYDVSLAFTGESTSGTATGNVVLQLVTLTPALAVAPNLLRVSTYVASGGSPIAALNRVLYFEAGAELQVNSENLLSGADTFDVFGFGIDVEFTKVK